VEVLSPDDETYAKFDFYADHDVEEIVVADPARRLVQFWRLTAQSYSETTWSRLLEVRASDLTDQIDWP
jgi:Uma2 family endonuclease